MKEFLKNNSHLKLTIQRSDEFGGCFVVDIYNLTLDRYSPVFKHVYTDLECENINVDFNTFIMTPIRAWKKEQDDKRKKLLEGDR